MLSPIGYWSELWKIFRLFKESTDEYYFLKFLTTEQVDQFQRNGSLVIEDLLHQEELKTLGQKTDSIVTGKLPHIPQTSVQLEPIFRSGENTIVNQVLSVRKLYDIAVYDDRMW